MKRRIFKQFLSGILGILLLLSLAGCGQSTSNSKPDDTMEAFYDLIIKQDTTSMTDLGIDDSEASDTLKTYQTSIKIRKMQQLRCLANTSIIWTFLNKQNRLLWMN